MLGLDQNGQGKVWINKNYALNSVQTTTNYEGVFHQRYVVKRIFQIINEKIRQRGARINFYERDFEESIKNLTLIMNSRKQAKIAETNYRYLEPRETPKL